MKRKKWTQEEIEKARELLKKHSYSTPPPDSKYTAKKEKNISLDF